VSGVTSAGLDPALAAWSEETLEGRMVRCERTPGGGSRHSYFVTVEQRDGSRRDAVLRVEAGGSFSGTAINVAKEAVVYRALARTSVPVPEVLGVAPGGAALLLEMLPGASELGDSAEERHAALMSFVGVLAEMHRIDVEELHLPGFPRPRTARDNAVMDLEMWVGLGEEVSELDPLIRYAGAFLTAHPPETAPSTCLVQGDTGPGNFLAHGGEVTGLCDMEFAHLGDPMDDIAWVTSRTAPLIEDLSPYLAEYSARSGITVLEANVRYYRVAVQYRCAVTTSLAVARGGGARGWPPYLLVTQRYLRGLARELSDYMNVFDEPVDLPEIGSTERTSWYDAVLAAIRAGVRGIADPQLREETRNHQILVHYLRAYDLIGPTIAELDADDGARSLGLDTRDAVSLGAFAEAAGITGDEAVLKYLLRRRRRQGHLWLTLLDR
jgi:aminoglycoside phosphotransferase (APT) family kinase protein